MYSTTYRGINMFNVQVLNDAVTSLTDEGRIEIQKLVDTFEGYKTEVVKLTDLAEGFEQVSIQLVKEKEQLQAHLDFQAEKITMLTNNLNKSDSIKLQEGS